MSLPQIIPSPLGTKVQYQEVEQFERLKLNAMFYINFFLLSLDSNLPQKRKSTTFCSYVSDDLVSNFETYLPDGYSPELYLNG